MKSREAAEAANVCASPIFPQIRKLALVPSFYHFKRIICMTSCMKDKFKHMTLFCIFCASLAMCYLSV